MQPMWLCHFSCRRFEKTFENTQWRKVIQMLPVWLCIRPCICFEAIFEKRIVERRFEKTQQRKVKQNVTGMTMHPLKQAIWGDVWNCSVKKMLLCLFWGWHFEETFEKKNPLKLNCEFVLMQINILST